MSTSDNDSGDIARTPLYDLHIELGAKMVPFAGYDMPVSYPLGVLGEHNHTRDKVGLFDVSHMGQAFLVGPDHETTAKALEALVPGAVLTLGKGRIRYTQLLNDDGGIIDDLMVTRSGYDEDDGRLFLVVNAGCKQGDYAHIEAHLPANVRLERVEDRALLAIQGPGTAEMFASLCSQAKDMGFMTALRADINGVDCWISRCGYTGEDGYEISVPEAHAEDFARTLLAHEAVAAIGLGARDSLRLESGLCLYGHDIDTTTSPVEADLMWSIAKRRREEGGFPGFERVTSELENGPKRIRVGIVPQTRAPAREDTVIHSKDGHIIGVITSGGYGPTFGGPIAMGYVVPEFSAEGCEVDLLVRGKPMPAKIASMPFVPQRYYRKPKI
ncbi:MAG TPA: glycine cleavage system aminomethyltransferase GcvT [Rhizobiales bacterium]|nr:glycine cleavage system aminomethyltransferase GcvT [Hyphomicrobiales bacterium]